MQKCINYCVFIGTFFPLFGAYCQTMNGNELLEKLSQKDTGAFLYLIGVVDAANASKIFFVANLPGMTEESAKSGALEIGKLWGCMPEKATYGQVADVTVAYLKKRPEVRHLGAIMLIPFAMKEAWPC